MPHSKDSHSSNGRESLPHNYQPSNHPYDISAPTHVPRNDLLSNNPSLPNRPLTPTATSVILATPVLVPEFPTPYGHLHSPASLTTSTTPAATVIQPSSSTRTSGTAGTESASKKSNGDGDEDDVDIDDNPVSSHPHGDQINASDPNAPPGAAETDAERRQRRREERRQRQKEEADAARELELENDARRLFRFGFFALPLLWLLSLFYFHREYQDENASDKIKKYYARSRLMLIIYTAIFVTWFIIFQTNKDALSAINIQSVKGRSPSGI